MPAAVLLCSTWPIQAAFTPVDNFNALTNGNIGGQGGWLATDATSAQVIVDPGNVINKILHHNGSGDAGKLLPATIAENSTGTYFFRVKRVSGTSDTSFGLSDSTTLSTGNLSNFGSFEVQPNIVGNALRGRDVGNPYNVVSTMSTTAWYKVWLVVNNVAGNGTAGAIGDNYKIYVQSVDDGAFFNQTEYLPPNTPPPADGVWNFRNGTSVALGIAQFTSNVAGTSVYFDDLYIDNTGANLTDPTFVADPDTDDDGLEDAWEVFYFTTITTQNGDDGVTNGDADGLSNYDEQYYGTNPIIADTDGDGLNDGAELSGAFNAYSPDTPTSPTKADTDGDGLNDFQENGSLNNLFGNAATDPNNPDTDSDTFPDYAEIQQYSTNPNNAGSVPLLLTLISDRVRNGSFELLGPPPGVENTAMASHWDTDADGDVTYWSLWPGETTLATNSGTEAMTPVTHARKRAYLQPENAAYNLTDHLAVEGETVAFKFDHVADGAPTLRVGLVYDNGGVITRFPTAAEVSSTTTGNGRGLIYTIQAGSPVIGKKIGIGMKASTAAFQRVDNVLLTVTAADVDLDGLADQWEDRYFGNNDGTAIPGELALYDGDDLAPDNDAFSNLQEQTAGSDPTSPASYPGDIDADGFNDPWEVTNFLTISSPNGDPGDDPDGDRDINSVEYANVTNPNDKSSFYSSTSDTVPDSWKAFYGIIPQTGADDLDEGTGDGLLNVSEFYGNTDPTDKDTDNDGLEDGPELTAFSNPLVQDTDGDGLLDGPEVNSHLSSPILEDTDGDSFGDKYEVDHGTLPNNALSFPTQPTGFTKVEDFQGAGMTVGQTFNGVNGWYATLNSWAMVAAEPVAGGGDHVGVLTRVTSAAQSPLRKSLGTDGLQIRQGNTGTLFFQFYCSAAALDQSIGLTDLPTGITFSDLEAQFATVGGNFIVRDGLPTSVNRDTTFDYTINQWMNVWIVANNSTDTIKVYVQTPTGQTGQIQITNADLGVDPFDFRNGVATNALSHFLVVNNGGENLPVYIDNIYVDALAQNLTVPTGVTKPGLGDGDSMDDAWEVTYFGNTAQTETGDFDNDGTNNLTEYRLGLIPNSGSSRFAVGSTQATVGNFTLTWPSKTGVTFKIERSTTLAADSWSTLQAAYPGTAGTTTYNDATAPAGTAFYKVTLNP